MIKIFKNKYKLAVSTVRVKHPEVYTLLNRHRKIVKFVISGGLAAVVDLLALYIFTDIFGIWYVFSTILAFCLAFAVSFNMQKFWTFEDSSTDHIASQATLFFMITTVLNLVLNTYLVFAAVRYLDLHYLLSQLIVGAVIAVISFFLYQILIFNKK